MATIYVELLDEGVECWRPVEAERIEGDLYRILGAPSDDERWAFPSRSIVRCSHRVLQDGPTALGIVRLVAHEQVG